MTTTPTFDKNIAYDRETRDFRAELNGNLIGFYSSYHAAEIALDQVAYDLLMDGQCATAAELDSGSDSDTIVADRAVAAPADCSTCGSAGECPDCDAVVQARQRCLLCGGDHSADRCPRIRHWSRDLPAYGAGNCAGCGGAAPCGCDDEHTPSSPILAPATTICPGAFDPCDGAPHPTSAPFCADCARALDRIAVAAYIQRLAEDVGLACSFCGEPHDAAGCPLRRPLVVPGPRVY